MKEEVVLCVVALVGIGSWCWQTGRSKEISAGKFNLNLRARH